MSAIEALRDTFHLPDSDAEFIFSLLWPGEEVIAKVGPKTLDWLKEKAKETGYRFVAVTTLRDTLFIYVDTGDSVDALPFKFKGRHPLSELWRASVSADFKDNWGAYFVTRPAPHRPN